MDGTTVPEIAPYATPLTSTCTISVKTRTTQRTFRRIDQARSNPFQDLGESILKLSIQIGGGVVDWTCLARHVSSVSFQSMLLDPLSLFLGEQEELTHYHDPITQKSTSWLTVHLRQVVTPWRANINKRRNCLPARSMVVPSSRFMLASPPGTEFLQVTFVSLPMIALSS